ncbi:MAG: NfeD family protein [Salibacteraceae bacterium]
MKNWVFRFIYFLMVMFCYSNFAKANSHSIFVFEITDEIAEPVWHNFQIALSQAKENQCEILIINMNTYGGGVEMADSIRTAILRTEIPVYMLINNNAASAGALISIACDKIFMTPGATIGAATVVTQDGAPAIDKYQSYFRSKMRATAEVTGRDPDIAEAMVDQDIYIPNITEEGKLLTFTVSEAIEHNFCEGEVNDLEDVLVLIGQENAPITTYKPSTTNVLIGWLISPAISGVLIMLMLGGIYFELQSPGIGFPIAASFVAALLFFAPLYLEGIAENWEIILFLIGIILVAIEIFVIPGMGIIGILGVVLMFTGLTLSMIENVQFDFSMVSFNGILSSFSIVLMASLAMAILTLIMLPKMLDSGRMNALVLNESQEVKNGFIGVEQSINKHIGQTGIVGSDLRPSGKIIINNKYYDATSMGGFIEKGSSIIVVSTEGPQLIVKKG